ncbi:MAG TPA: c-type cytochrome [Chitinophagaceae bacterium]|nr:c-type cytochrome [Chitinophagaceae bacterium]
MMIHSRKKLLVLSLIVGLLTFGTFAFKAPTENTKPHYPNNLKVLPKDISHEQIMNIMKSFTVALDFECTDCHAKSKEDPSEIDWMSYDKKNKKVALKMMKMVKKINAKYFDVKGDFMENYLRSKFAVTCQTCHGGSSDPVNTISIPVEHEKPEK